MKKNLYRLSITLLIILPILASCNMTQEAPSSNGNQPSLSVDDSVEENAKSDQSLGENTIKKEPNDSEMKSEDFSPNSDPSLAESSVDSEDHPEISITVLVKPVSMYGEHDSFYITDLVTQNQIIALLSQIQPQRLLDPSISGYVFEITIQQNKSTEHFTVLSHTDELGNCYVSKDDILYIADHSLWRALVELFPLFDYENNQPQIMIDVTNELKNSSIGLSYYEQGKAIWSEEEQKRSTIILSYMSRMEPVTMKKPHRINQFERVSIALYYTEEKMAKYFTCYDSYDNTGSYLIEYHSSNDWELDVRKDFSYWYVVEEGLYPYLVSLFMQ